MISVSVTATLHRHDGEREVKSAGSQRVRTFMSNHNNSQHRRVHRRQLVPFYAGNWVIAHECTYPFQGNRSLARDFRILETSELYYVVYASFTRELLSGRGFFVPVGRK